MDVVLRIGVSAWRLLRCAYPKHEIVLRHGSSGRLLIADFEDPEPVRFPSPAAALAFRTRWLDEPQAWAPQPAASGGRGSGRVIASGRLVVEAEPQGVITG